MTNEEHQRILISLGPGCYFLLTIWAQVLQGAPADVARLAAESDISKPTVAKYLDKLRCYGYVLPAGERWQLTGHIVQLGFFREQSRDELVPMIDGELVDDAEAEPAATETSAKKNFFSLEEDDDYIESEDILESSSSSDSEIGRKKIFLDRSDLLFESGGVLTQGLDLALISAEDILGWLAEAYATQGRLSNPAGLVYKRLQACMGARELYKRAAGQYLPAEYLRAIGREDLIPVEVPAQRVRKYQLDPLYRG